MCGKYITVKKKLVPSPRLDKLWFESIRDEYLTLFFFKKMKIPLAIFMKFLNFNERGKNRYQFIIVIHVLKMYQDIE